MLLSKLSTNNSFSKGVADVGGDWVGGSNEGDANCFRIDVLIGKLHSGCLYADTDVLVGSGKLGLSIKRSGMVFIPILVSDWFWLGIICLSSFCN